MVRRDTVVILEHKGGRPGTEFLTGGEGDKVLGPSNDILRRLDTGVDVLLEEGRESDDGILTRGMWQQSCVAEGIAHHVQHKYGVTPRRFFPLLTNLAEIRVDSLTRSLYLDPLIREAGLYSRPGWEYPQWLLMTDLECVAEAVERGSADVETLLHEKSISQNRALQFDSFLIGILGGAYVDHRLAEIGEELMSSALSTFWPQSR